MDVNPPKRKRAVLADVSNNDKIIVTRKRAKSAIKPSPTKKTVSMRVTRAVKQRTEDETVVPLESTSATNETSSSEIEVSQTEQLTSVEMEVDEVREVQQVWIDEVREVQQVWIDVDQIYDSIHYMPEYVNDVFEYYLERESLFPVADYMVMGFQEVTEEMRAILVDWLVEVQQSFELNHETLYTAVKLFDLYMSKNPVRRSHVQLVGAVALFVACKFDERCPRSISDFIYVCDDAYTMDDFIEMEVNLLKGINFSLGPPLSYTFLRRYAQCARVSGLTLTLARYILEFSLMHYQFVKERESVMACASLYIAMAMNRNGSWDSTVLHYTGKKPKDFLDVALALNRLMADSPYRHLVAIKQKYGHVVFQFVSRIPLISDERLIQFSK